MRGQLSIASANADSTALKTVLCGKYGYITPAVQGSHFLGATYDYHNLDLRLRREDHEYNLRAWVQYLPGIPAPIVDSLSGRVAIRCVNKQRLPIFGALDGQSGIFASLAHGSRGLLTAPLAAMSISSHFFTNL